MIHRSAALRLGTVLVVLVLQDSYARADIITEWNEVLLDKVAQEQQSPPQISRALAMMHAAMYDAVNAVERTHKPYRYAGTAAAGTSAEAATAQAAYQVTVALFPDHRSSFDALLRKHLNQVPAGAGKQAGIELGQEIAFEMIEWRAMDGSDQEVVHVDHYTAGKWRRTPPDYQPALLPQWATVVPFAMQSPAQFRQPAPPDLTSELYTNDFNEVKELGAATSEKRTADQTEIAQFWADGAGTATPPGHWNRIAQTIAKDRSNTMPQNARLFALLNIALADAAISCWDMKYAHNCWRPITAIRQADTDGNPDTESDRTWEPLLPTPPFPSCSSGHSTFSGTAAVILILFYNTEDITFSSTSDDGQLTRSFSRPADAAYEAGRSRIYGGIHFEFENQKGLAAGEELSKYVFTTYLTPVEQPQSIASPADRQTDKVEGPKTFADDTQPQTPAPEPQTFEVPTAPAPPAQIALAPPSAEACVVLQPVAPPAICPPTVLTPAADADGWRPAVTGYRYAQPNSGASVTSYYFPSASPSHLSPAPQQYGVTTYYPVETSLFVWP